MFALITIVAWVMVGAILYAARKLDRYNKR